MQSAIMGDDMDVKEIMAVDELKKRMKGDMHSDMYEDETVFRRFLKARDFKVDQAEEMLRNANIYAAALGLTGSYLDFVGTEAGISLEWRIKYDIKNIFTVHLPELLEESFILVTLGYDKEGSIVKYNPFGITDLRGIFESCKTEEWFKFLIRRFEKDILELKQQSEKLGKLVEKVIYIENLEHFGLAKATDKKVIYGLASTIHMYLDNYPEMLKAVYVINAPIYFNIFFSIMKPFLPSTVIQKIKIYSDDSWRKDLLEAVDAEVLPAFLGGKRTDPDGNPLCLELIKQTQPVPKRYYLSKNKKVFANSPDVKNITISRSSIHEICLEVTEQNSHLEWEFLLKSGDIKFGIFHKDNKGTKTEILPVQKLNTDECSESGIYMCKDLGTYIIVFDNSDSFLRAKEIFYKTRIKCPLEDSCH